jgi:hypothetical protein
VPEYARGTAFETAFPLVHAQFRIAGAPDGRGKSKLELSVTPRRRGAPLTHPVEVSIGIALPWALTQGPPRERSLVVRTPDLALTRSHQPADGISGRDQFIRRVLMAEVCFSNRKLDVAIAILDDLAEQIDRYHLDEWESSDLITHVWDLLRRCYLTASGWPEAGERAEALFRRICRLDPKHLCS